MIDLPLAADPDLTAWLARAFDQEGKIVRALVELGPIEDRDVAAWGALPAWFAGRLDAAGVRRAPAGDVASAAGFASAPATSHPAAAPATPASADLVLGAWSSFRGADPAEIADAERLLRPDGRLVALHDYGRDDIARLTGDRPEYSTWSRKDGPFTAAGFKIRVLHCWWTFTSVEEAGGFLAEAFGAAAAELAASLRRPRLAHNVAVYHRGR